jgi:hypothetical protein
VNVIAEQTKWRASMPIFRTPFLGFFELHINIIDFGIPVTCGDDEIRGIYEVVFSKLQ